MGIRSAECGMRNAECGIYTLSVLALGKVEKYYIFNEYPLIVPQSLNSTVADCLKTTRWLNLNSRRYNRGVVMHHGNNHEVVEYQTFRANSTPFGQG